MKYCSGNDCNKVATYKYWYGTMLFCDECLDEYIISTSKIISKCSTCDETQNLYINGYIDGLENNQCLSCMKSTKNELDICIMMDCYEKAFTKNEDGDVCKKCFEENLKRWYRLVNIECDGCKIKNHIYRNNDNELFCWDCRIKVIEAKRL